MKIFVDADACPVVGIIETMAEKYNIPTTLLCYTNHVLTSVYPEVGIAPGTKWEDVPEDFECPLCNVGKNQFSEVE